MCIMVFTYFIGFLFLLSFGTCQEKDSKIVLPSDLPPGTEIIYLDENGNVIGNKTLILPKEFELKEESAKTTEQPSTTSQPAVPSRPSTIDWHKLNIPTEAPILPPGYKAETSKVPKPRPTTVDWHKLNIPTEPPPVPPGYKQSTSRAPRPKPSTIDWHKLNIPTEEPKLPPGYKLVTTEVPTEKPSTSKTQSAIDRLNIPTEAPPLPPGFKLPTSKAPRARPSTIDWHKLNIPTEAPKLPPGYKFVSTEPPTTKPSKAPSAIDKLNIPTEAPRLPPGFYSRARRINSRSSTVDWHNLAAPTESAPKAPPRPSPRPTTVDWAKLAIPTEKPIIDESVKSTRRPRPSRRPTTVDWSKLAIPTEEPIIDKSVKSTRKPRPSRRPTTVDWSKFAVPTEKSPEQDSKTSSYNNKNAEKSHRFIATRNDENSSKGKIKGIGIKTSVSTSFEIRKNATTDKAKKSILRSKTGQSSGIQTDDQKSIDDAIKDISLDKFKLNLGVPVNISTGNYTITFFGKVTTERPKPVPDASAAQENGTIVINQKQNSIKANVSSETKTTTTLEPEKKKTVVSGGGRLRWPLTRRRKLSTARRILLRTRNPIPTKRTPRPLRPTKSTRPNKWRPRSRAPPRFTTRLSIFQKFKTVPTRPPTTTTTTTEHVYTRRPESDDVLTSDFIKSSGVIKIEDGIEWTNSLADKNSKEFKTLALDLKVLLQEVFKNSVWAPVFVGVNIDGFYKGSVVVDYDVIFKRAIANRIKPIHLKKILVDTLNRDGGQLGTYTVNYTSIIFDAFTDLLEPSKESPTTEEDNSVLPQWAIAAIVISIASLLFLVIFSCVAYCNKPAGKKRNSERFIDDSGDIEKIPPGNDGYDNLAIDSLYDLDPWNVPQRPYKQSKNQGKSNGKRRKDRYYDSWKTEWSGYKGPTRPAMSEF